jgi:chromosome partitioning protein
MDKCFSVVNHKGGVGKTTSAVNLAACFGSFGKKVLLIDLDPQGSASSSLGLAPCGAGLLQALQSSTALPVSRNACANVDVVVAGPELAAASQRFTGAMGNDLLARCLRRSSGPWDLVVIDCPPTLGVLTLNALRCSRYAVVPLECSPLALAGLEQILATIAELQKTANPSLELLAVLPCRAHPRRRLHGQIIRALNERFPGRIAPAVRENAALAEAPGEGKPITSVAPRSHGAEDYVTVTQWLWRQLYGSAVTEASDESRLRA